MILRVADLPQFSQHLRALGLDCKRHRGAEDPDSIQVCRAIREMVQMAIWIRRIPLLRHRRQDCRMGRQGQEPPSGIHGWHHCVH